MPADKVLFNGKLYEQLPAELLKPFDSNYIYQHIHTRGHAPLHIEEHLEIADAAMRNIHGYATGMNAEEISHQVKALLLANRYPEKAAKVTMRIFPGGKGRPDILLECRSLLLYPRYTLWHKRVTAEIFPCEYLFMGYPTAVSHITANYAETYAIRNNSDAAIIENCNSVLTNVGDEPLFIVKGRDILTSPIEEGATDSVMRRLVFRAAKKEGINIIEEPLRREVLEQCDEAFFPTVQGITSIRGFGQRSFYYIVSGKISEGIEKISTGV